jgi:LPXTG-motif cell wall-anchored protein
MSGAGLGIWPAGADGLPERNDMRARPVRLFLAAAASVATALSLAPPASAASTGSDTGLFGVQVPTYDGVYRQSLAIMGLVAVGKTPDANAVNWLLAQQCSDGAFTAYRADTSKACTAKREDENATAGAIMALAALGKSTTTAVAALKKFQLADGGFYDNTAFGPPASDANSTGLALSALAAVGIDPASVTTGGKNGDDYLRSLQIACSASAGAGAYDFQAEPTLVANDYATVQATLGQLGKALPLAPASVATAVPTCADATDAAGSAANAIGYLASRLTATNGAIPSSFGSGTDWTTTANAVLDLVAAGQGSAAVDAGVAALKKNARAYTTVGGAGAPGPLGTLLLVARATGSDPANFGGVDLAAALAATERTAATVTSPAASPSTPPSPASVTQPTLPMTGTRGALPLGLVGAGLVLAGAAALVASRRRGVES